MGNHLFGGKMGVAATMVPKGLGQKLVYWVDFLGQPFPRGKVAEIQFHPQIF